MINFKTIKDKLTKPELYEKGTIKLWQDEHISKGMLQAHLSENEEGASRPHKDIDASVAFISKSFPSQTHASLIDLGCGPGLYTTRLHDHGYQVTGMDFSERSIAYAKDQAQRDNKDIKYRLESYLEMKDENLYDLALMIYYDYAVLSHEERRQVLTAIYRALKTGGKFIFDVFTTKAYEQEKESFHYRYFENGSFYKKETHLCLHGHHLYEDSIRLDQYLIISDQGIESIHVWDKAFSLEEMKAEITQVGFKVHSLYSDAQGNVYHEDSKTMCLVVEK